MYIHQVNNILRLKSMQVNRLDVDDTLEMVLQMLRYMCIFKMLLCIWKIGIETSLLESFYLSQSAFIYLTQILSIYLYLILSIPICFFLSISICFYLFLYLKLYLFMRTKEKVLEDRYIYEQIKQMSLNSFSLDFRQC